MKASGSSVVFRFSEHCERSVTFRNSYEAAFMLLMMVKPRSQMRGRTANALFSIPLSSRRSDNLASSKTRESATTDRNPILAEVNLNSAS
jgi:hypothetical protein